MDLATGGLQNVDLAAGLMYYRARFYDAALERFINRDPIESGPNLYEYVGDSPVRYFDPFGLVAVEATPYPLPPPVPGINDLGGNWPMDNLRN